jgi:hypothetical protein
MWTEGKRALKYPHEKKENESWNNQTERTKLDQ